MKLSLKAIVMAITFTTVLTACVGGDSTPVKLTDIQGASWYLTKVDGKSLNMAPNKKPPFLNIDHQTTATGMSGCNSFVGEAELKPNDHRFRIIHLNSTLKLCLQDEQKLEDIVTQTLSEWSQIDMTKDTLTLSGKKHTLVYQAEKK
jgi:heat shock protein HslJ